MSLRTRLFLGFAVVVVVPMTLLALGIRQEMTGRLSEEYARRLDAAVEVIEDDLQIEDAGIGERLASLRAAILNDNRFRLAAVAGVESERAYLLDYAGTAVPLTGLSMLQILDGDGRILSSGHFRNEHGRLDASLPAALAGTRGEVTIVSARAPHGEFLALARSEPFRLGAREFVLVGGVAIDEAFVRRLARDEAIAVSLVHPGGVLSSAPPGAAAGADHAVREIAIPLIDTGSGAPGGRAQAHLVVTQPRTPIRALVRSVDSWFLGIAAAAGAMALGLAAWLSSRISRPIAALADKTAVLDLDRLDVAFDEGTDEVGRLSRLLGDLAARLRTSTARIREAERRATVGDLARQVNHDIKNGLIPLRNVLRHLAQVGRDAPGDLPMVLAERQQTVDSSIDYLETLATNYERLSRVQERRACDVNPSVAEAVRGIGEHGHVDLRTRLATGLPRVVADPIALRRILENLTANAVDSLRGEPGRVTISTELVERDEEPPAIRVIVADTGCGMSSEEASRIFTDFYTTKPGGTGLGLSIVRRLVMDLHGSVRVESQPGAGTRMIVDLPVAADRT